MINLTGSTLNLEQMKAVLYKESAVSLDEKAIERVKKSRLAVEKIVREDRTVYGINTGFGKFSDVKIDEKDTKALQLHLIRSHACGVGESFPDIVSRAMVVLRLNALMKGFSGIRAEVLERFAIYGEPSNPSCYSATRFAWGFGRFGAARSFRTRTARRRLCLARTASMFQQLIYGKNIN